MKYQIVAEKKAVPVTRENALAYWSAWEAIFKLAGVIPQECRIDPVKVMAMYPPKPEKDEAHV